MAQLTSIITFTGRLGNIIAYNRGGKHCLRSRPETVRQTDGTRRAALRFGAASRKGALIRSAICPELDFPCDGRQVNQLTRTIITAGSNRHAGLTGFRFNAQTGTGSFFSQRPEYSKNGTLHIPAQRLLAPDHASHLEIKVISTRIDFTNRRVTGTDASVALIDLRQPFTGADLHVDAPGKGTLLITLQVSTYINGTLSQNRRRYAADIIAVAEGQPPAPIMIKARPTPKRLRQPRPRARNAATLPIGYAYIQRE
ncbi:hypothetical protein WJU16_04555 [Chitinophaga pollutisoli]|uniref:Uncharacterized protein n=1 Tax=Chitinophaga pollutisoli TaxID=3133966 RepID=A0ABZ2YS39_9BACT